MSIGKLRIKPSLFFVHTNNTPSKLLFLINCTQKAGTSNKLRNTSFQSFTLIAYDIYLILCTSATSFPPCMPIYNLTGASFVFSNTKSKYGYAIVASLPCGT